MSSNEKSGASDPVTSVVNLFASPKLTLILLSVIAALSFLGVTGRWGFQGVYHERYFQVILGLLFTNLLVCTVDRLPGAWRRVRMNMGPLAPPPPKSPHFAIKVKDASPEEVLSRAEELIFEGKSGLRREVEILGKSKKPEDPEEGIPTEKAYVSFRSVGAISVLGPHVTHLGILITIVGALIGGVYSLDASMTLAPGQQKDYVFAKSKSGPMGQREKIQLDFAVRCNDFQITYYGETPMASDYLCDLSIIENGREVKQKVIEVNSPLYFGGYGFYQSTYEHEPGFKLTAVETETGDTVSVETALFQKWTVPGSTTAYRVVDFEERATGMGRDLGPKAVVEHYEGNALVETISLFSNYPSFYQGREDRFRVFFEVTSTRLKTGLGVIRDPGLPVVWVGFALLVIGVMQSFFIHHRRTWLVAAPAGGVVELKLIGRANKGKFMFDKKLDEMAELLKNEFGESKSG